MNVVSRSGILFFAFSILISCGKKKKDDEELKMVAIDPVSLALKIGSDSTLKAIGTFGDEHTEDVTARLAWSTESNGALSKVESDSSSKVTGVAVGTDKIFAKDRELPDVTASIEVTISKNEDPAPSSTPSPVSPSDPTNLSASSSSVSAISLSWQSGGAGSVSHKLSYVTGATAPTTCSNGTVISEATIGTSTSYSLSGLSANTIYSFRICGVGASGDTSSGVTISKSTLAYQRIFVSANTYTGATVGGLSGADSKCQTDANAQSLGGTWKAILSDGTTSATSRIAVNTPIQNMRPSGSGGPQTVANNASALWSGTLAASINYTAAGGTPGGTAMWTATTSTGTYSGASCSNWGSTTGSANKGLSSSTSSTWIANSTATCTTGQRLYCVDGQ